MKQELSVVAIDLAKKIFHLVGADTTGKILWRKRLTRHALMPFIAQLPPVCIGIEACGSRTLAMRIMFRDCSQTP
jgi:transposase